MKDSEVIILWGKCNELAKEVGLKLELSSQTSMFSILKNGKAILTKKDVSNIFFFLLGWRNKDMY